LRIVPPIPESFGVWFNGWNRSPNPAANTYAIHHPMGMVKKISFNDDPLVPSQVYPAGTHWQVTDWEQGVTAAGSSGGPLFDPAGRIVGELHSGLSACDCDPAMEDCSDQYGRFSTAWLGGGSPPNSLITHLDPGGVGTVGQPGMDQSFCVNPLPRLEHAAHDVDDGQGNEDGVADPGDIAIVGVSLANTGPVPATGVSATLSTDDPEVTVLRVEASYPSVSSGQTVSSQAPDYMIDIDPDRDCARSILFELEAVTNQGIMTSDFRLYTGEETGTAGFYADDMESGAPGWVPEVLQGTTNWSLQTSLAHGGLWSWYVANSFFQQDAVLRAPLLSNLPARARLTFHFAASTGTGDGAVLEYRTGGSTWFDARELIVSGEYNSLLAPTVPSPLAGRYVWTGGAIGSPQDWRLVEVDLSAFEGQDLELRWRFATNGTGNGIGWFLDDVVVEAPEFDCAPARSRLVPGALCRGHRPAMPGAQECGQRRPQIGRGGAPAR
jgi:hypothetical protein